MKNIDILAQLLNGDHLESNELKQAETLLNRLQNELKNRTI